MADPRTIRPEISPPVDGDKSKGGNMITRRLINKRKSELVAPLSPHEKEARMEELGSPQPTDPVSELPADAGDGIAQSMRPTHTGNMDENPRAEKRKKLEELIANPDVSLQPKTD